MDQDPLNSFEPEKPAPEPKKQTNWKKIISNVAVIGAVFFFGIFIGNNSSAYGPDAVFRQAVGENQSIGPINLSSVNELYDKLIDSFDGPLDKNKLEEGLKTGLIEGAGDEYTEYLTPDEAKELEEQLSGSFEGIGAELGKDGESVIIISPINGFPAEKAGLMARDIISKIDGESAFDISISDAVQKIRGEKGTDVKLEIIRDGEVKEFTITRATINIPSVEWEITDQNIGVLTISRFGEDTVRLAQQAANEFKEKNVKGVILDLRSNPGGLLEASVKISEIWLQDGSLILEEKREDEVVKSFSADGTPILGGVPTLILVNEGSASASEIVAGALRDNGVATIIGKKTFGKGSVQELQNLSDGGILKVTVARWFTPNGVNIDQEGITPDKEVELTAEDLENERDPQLDEAKKQLEN